MDRINFPPTLRDYVFVLISSCQHSNIWFLVIFLCLFLFSVWLSFITMLLLAVTMVFLFGVLKMWTLILTTWLHSFNIGLASVITLLNRLLSPLVTSGKLKSTYGCRSFCVHGYTIFLFSAELPTHLVTSMCILCSASLYLFWIVLSTRPWDPPSGPVTKVKFVFGGNGDFSFYEEN